MKTLLVLPFNKQSCSKLINTLNVGVPSSRLVSTSHPTSTDFALKRELSKYTGDTLILWKTYLNEGIQIAEVKSFPAPALLTGTERASEESEWN